MAEFPKLQPSDLKDLSLFRLNSILGTAFEQIQDLQNRHTASASTVSVARTTVAAVGGGSVGSSGPVVTPTDFTTTGINNAVTALPVTGGIVQLQDGTYTYSGVITVPDTKSNISIVGNGPSSKVLGDGTTTAGSGIFDLLGTDIVLSNFLIDGDVTTATKLLYSDFAYDPMDAQLTTNTSVWIKSGAVRISLDNMWITHTGGYAVLIDADSADISEVSITNSNFYNNRPHLFGVVAGDILGTGGYGSWTGGIFYRGDCRTSASKPFAVRGLTVQGCMFKRNTGNCVWGHSYGFDTQHTSIDISANAFEDIALDGIEMGNVYGGTVTRNTFHRVGYVTQTDSDTPEPRFGVGKNAVAMDTTGFARACVYDGNVATSINGEFIDADGLRDSTISNNIGLIPLSGDPQYVEDSVASYQANGVGGNTTRGIQTGNTSSNGGGNNVKIIGNILTGFGMSSILLAYGKGCTIANNHIIQSPNTAEVPIQVFAASGGSGNEWLTFNNIIDNNSIEFTGANFCIAETGTGWTSTHINRIFNTRMTGANYGEFLRIAASASTVGVAFSTNSDIAAGSRTADKRTLVQREGVDSTGAVKFYAENISTGVKTQLAQLGDGAILNVSTNGASLTGNVGTAGRTAFLFGDCMAAGKLLADSCLILTDTTRTYPNDTNLDTLNDTYAMIAYDSTAKVVNLSTSVSGGHRVWASLTGASSGPTTQVQYSTGSGGFGSSADFTFNAATKLLSVLGTAATATIAVTGGWVQSVGGFIVDASNTAANAINVPAGGATAKFLVATDSLFFIHEAAPAVAGAGQSRVYMDSTSHHLMASENGGAYVPLISAASVAGSSQQVQYNSFAAFGASSNFTYDPTGQVLTVAGRSGFAGIACGAGYIQSDGGFLVSVGNTAATAINAPNAGVSAKFIIANDSLFLIQEAAPAVSSTGQTRIYMDSTTHKAMISQQGSAYVQMVGGLPGGTNTCVQFNDFSAFGGSTNFLFDKTLQKLTVTGIVATPTIACVTGYVSSDGGFATPSTSFSAINAPVGGLTAKYGVILGVGGYNDLQVAGGGMYTALGVTLDTALYVKTQGSAPPTPGGGYAGFSHVTGSQWRYYNPATAGWATIDFAGVGGVGSLNGQTGALTIAQGTGVSVSAAGGTITVGIGQAVGTGNQVTFAKVTATGNIGFVATAPFGFVSTTTGTNIAWQSGGGTFQIDGNGNASGSGTLNMNTGVSTSGISLASVGFKAGSTASIDNSGRFIGNGTICYAASASRGQNYITGFSQAGNTYTYTYHAGLTGIIWSTTGDGWQFEGGILTGHIIFNTSTWLYNTFTVNVTTF